MSGLKEIQLNFHGGGGGPMVEKQAVDAIAETEVKAAPEESEDSDDEESED